MRIISTLSVIAFTAGISQALESDDFVESFSVAINSPSSSYSSQLEFSYNQYTKSAGLLTSKISSSENDDAQLYLLNRESLTDVSVLPSFSCVCMVFQGL